MKIAYLPLRRHWLALLCLAGSVFWFPAQAQDFDFSPAQAQYLDLQPEFVLNYGQDGRVRFLRLEITLVMINETDVIDAGYHSAGLRHIVVMNVTGAQHADLHDLGRRDALRERILEDMREYMNRETGRPMIQQVLFSNLILQ
ncbi:flagellar basal body-associated FliL family protein [Salinispirillum sp. LH 10-3-1]|uniref:Flagellar protein FliL n=1 Tax=Salinispirillum sp. LH 10-3-1 TaxID=2952525 RepID=A0AB38YH68_9GAMM